MSSTVKGVPSCQLMPSRMWKVYCLPSELISQLSARSLTTSWVLVVSNCTIWL